MKKTRIPCAARTARAARSAEAGARGPRAHAEQRGRIIAGKLELGDVALLRRFVGLTQGQFAEALGISVRTLQNWEQDRVTPDGPGLALLRIAACDPSMIRKNLASVA